VSGARLIADIGGTNARFALAGKHGEISAPTNLRVADFPAFDLAMAAYLEASRVRAGDTITSAAIAGAGPVENGAVQLTNAPWRLDEAGISEQLGGVRVRVFNDLEAVAHALMTLGPGDVSHVSGPDLALRGTHGRRIAINVGTGFGAATLLTGSQEAVACPSEAGFIRFCPANEYERGVLDRLGLAGMAGVEDVLSGLALGPLYRACGGQSAALAARVVRADALFGSTGDPAARDALALFSAWLGRVSGDLVLATAAWDGAFLVGGVAGAWRPFADWRAFRQSFEDKGKMRARMRGVFAGVVTRPDLALEGLARVRLDDDAGQRRSAY
jgi:glucokinase